MKLEKRGDKWWLVGGTEERFVGEIHERTLFIERNPEKHLMKKWKAYGINAQAVQSDLIDAVLLTVDGQQYLATPDIIKTHGRLHKFEDFEEQYFLALEHFEKL